jgi:hypothetical protein
MVANPAMIFRRVQESQASNTKGLLTALRNKVAEIGTRRKDFGMVQVNKPNGRGVAHRLRDTFSVSLLERGVSIEIVATLLGNSVKVCEHHYALGLSPGRIPGGVGKIDLEVAVRRRC